MILIISGSPLFILLLALKGYNIFALAIALCRVASFLFLLNLLSLINFSIVAESLVKYIPFFKAHVHVA
jgi:hypothetical protein